MSGGTSLSVIEEAGVPANKTGSKAELLERLSERVHSPENSAPTNSHSEMSDYHRDRRSRGSVVSAMKAFFKASGEYPLHGKEKSLWRATIVKRS